MLGLRDSLYGTTLGGKLPVTVAGRHVCNCNLSVCNMQEPTHSVSAVCPTFRARNSRKTAAEYFLLVLRRPSSQNMHQLLFSVYNPPLASVLEKSLFRAKNASCFLLIALLRQQLWRRTLHFYWVPRYCALLKLFPHPISELTLTP